jgi:hypothetical protein
MLQEVVENYYFLQVSFARRLVSISGTVREIDLKLSQVQDMGLLHMHMALWVYCSATTTRWQKLELNKYLRNQASN